MNVFMISLTPEVYSALQAVASDADMDPEEWVAMQISHASERRLIAARSVTETEPAPPPSVRPSTILPQAARRPALQRRHISGW